MRGSVDCCFERSEQLQSQLPIVSATKIRIVRFHGLKILENT